jgi:hypothetical protein
MSSEEIQQTAEEATLAASTQDALVKEVKEPSALDKAAYDMQVVMPKALSLAANMKAGALYRVFSTVLQYPMIQNPKRFRSQAETDLFFMSLKLLNSKAILMKELAPSLEGVEDEAVEGIKDEILDTMRKEMTNGSN